MSFTPPCFDCSAMPEPPACSCLTRLACPYPQGCGAYQAAHQPRQLVSRDLARASSPAVLMHVRSAAGATDLAANASARHACVGLLANFHPFDRCRMLEVTSPEAEETGGFDFAASYADSELAEAANAMVDKLRCVARKNAPWARVEGASWVSRTEGTTQPPLRCIPGWERVASRVREPATCAPSNGSAHVMQHTLRPNPALLARPGAAAPLARPAASLPRALGTSSAPARNWVQAQP